MSTLAELVRTVQPERLPILLVAARRRHVPGLRDDIPHMPWER